MNRSSHPCGSKATRIPLAALTAKVILGCMILWLALAAMTSASKLGVSINR